MSRPAAVVTRERAAGGMLVAAARYLPTVAVGGAVFWLAYDGGTFGLSTRNTVGMALWWAILVAVAVGVWPVSRLPRMAGAAALALIGFAAVTVASTSWAASAENAFIEFDRVVLFIGVFGVTLLAFRRGQAGAVADGVALGIVATALLALGTRLYPNVIAGDDALHFLPAARPRLSYPLDYWNGLAIFTGLAFPLLLRAAISARSPLLRALSLAPLPALATVIYLTSSRGGVAVAGIGSVLFVLATNERAAALAALALGGAGSVFAVAIIRTRTDLVNNTGTALATSQGHTVGLLVALVCIAVALVWFIVAAFAGRALALGTNGQRAVAAGFAIVLVAGIVAAHPVRRFEAFKEPTRTASATQDFTQAHLLSGSGTGRWQQWASAIDEWRSRPWTGRGAGSYGAWWAQHGTLPSFITDAHSLWAETLGEVGILGFVFLVTFFGLGLAAAVTRLRRGHDRTTVAALGAGLVAYMVGAGIDWMWELTVVTVVAMILLGLLVGPATLPDAEGDAAPPQRRGLWRLAPLAVVVAGLALIYGEAVPVLADMRLNASEAAIARRDVASASSAAADARKIEPWASTPYLQLALVAEESGDLGQAMIAIRRAISRDRTNWRLWLVQSRLQTKRGSVKAAVRSLNRAAQLNPRSPLFASQQQKQSS